MAGTRGVLSSAGVGGVVGVCVSSRGDLVGEGVALLGGEVELVADFGL